MIQFLNLEGLIERNKKNQTNIPQQLFSEGISFDPNLRKYAYVTFHHLVIISQIDN
jgi:hypothetical protein